jgi:hypothetical protein
MENGLRVKCRSHTAAICASSTTFTFLANVQSLKSMSKPSVVISLRASGGCDNVEPQAFKSHTHHVAKGIEVIRKPDFVSNG